MEAYSSKRREVVKHTKLKKETFEKIVWGTWNHQILYNEQLNNGQEEYPYTMEDEEINILISTDYKMLAFIMSEFFKSPVIPIFL